MFNVGDRVKVVKPTACAPIGYTGKVLRTFAPIGGDRPPGIRIEGIPSYISADKLALIRLDIPEDKAIFPGHVMSFTDNSYDKKEEEKVKTLYSVKKVYAGPTGYKIYPDVEVVADSEEAAKIASGVYTPVEGEDANYVTITVMAQFPVKEREA